MTPAPGAEFGSIGLPTCGIPSLLGSTIAVIMMTIYTAHSDGNPTPRLRLRN